jgi:hypothetical protein
MLVVKNRLSCLINIFPVDLFSNFFLKRGFSHNQVTINTENQEILITKCDCPPRFCASCLSIEVTFRMD